MTRRLFPVPTQRRHSDPPATQQSDGRSTPIVRHVLTGRQLDLMCRAAGLADWTARRDRSAAAGAHPVDVTAIPRAALSDQGWRIMPRTAKAREAWSGCCLAVEVPGDHELALVLAPLLAALQAVAPAAYRDVVVGGLVWRGDGVAYLLGIEVAA